MILIHFTVPVGRSSGNIQKVPIRLFAAHTARWTFDNYRVKNSTSIWNITNIIVGVGINPYSANWLKDVVRRARLWQLNLYPSIVIIYSCLLNIIYRSCLLNIIYSCLLNIIYSCLLNIIYRRCSCGFYNPSNAM